MSPLERALDLSAQLELQDAAIVLAHHKGVDHRFICRMFAVRNEIVRELGDAWGTQRVVR